MMSFDDIKDSVIVKMVNTENNKDSLANRPNEKIEDMSVVFATVLSEKNGERLTLPITNEMMNDMGVDQAQLKEAALANISEQDYSFKSMRDVLIESMFPDGVPENDPIVEMMLPPEDPDMQMYVLTNGCNVNGAAEVLNQKAMDEIADKLGGDFVVLPSSVHETIILPLNDDMSPAILESMVQEINAGVVSTEDKLSDHVFQYDSKEHELVRMDKMESRQKEKDNSKNIDGSKEDRGSEKTDSLKGDKVENSKTEKKQSTSLQDRISKKQAEVDKKETSKPQPSKKRDVALA